MRMMTGLTLSVAVMILSSCATVRTVTDEQGNVIYQEPEIHTPFESDEKRRNEVMEKTRELGW